MVRKGLILYMSKKLWIGALVCALILTSGHAFAGKNVKTEEEKLKERVNSYTKVVNVQDDIFLVYAQNSEDWGDIAIGKGSKKRVKGSACACFSLANTIINCVPYEELPIIREATRYPIRIDSSSIVYGEGKYERASFEISRNEDYFRFFPLCIGNMACGNNYGLGDSFGSRGYYEYVLKLYGLEYEKIQELQDCINILKESNAYVIVCSGGSESPIAPKFGHYLVMAKYNDGKIYFLDSVFRDKYKDDKYGCIHPVEPGLFYVNEEDLDLLKITGTNFIVRPKKSHEKYSTEKIEKLIELSNTY